jgi:aminoglycoside/choline kinase family phosphotransferase
MAQEDEIARELVEASDALRGATVSAVEELAGDMSTRRYSRVTLANSPVSTAIMMTLSGAPGPVGGGPRGLTQDDTYVEVGAFLRQHGVRVPHLYADARAQGRLLVEDVGSLSLLDVSKGSGRSNAGALLQSGADPLEVLYSKALRFQRIFSQLPKDESVVIYQRQTTALQRAAQIREFLEHCARPRGFSLESEAVVEKLMEVVCERVSQHPLQPSHFDFMASNIHVLPDGELCLIDFQDMCIDSPARDVVSLLNDRDSDTALGQERQRRLLQLFMREINSHRSFPQMYDEYLLLWDLRVSGRFALLAEKRGVERYKAWIPGTLRRLGRTLVRARNSIPHAEEALVALSRFSPEIAQGQREPWDFPV